MSVRAFETATAPATVQEFGVAIGRLVEFAETVGIELGDTRKLTELYRRTLSDIPSDLLMDAIGYLERNHRYSNKLKPADIRAAIAERLANRRMARGKHELALSLALRGKQRADEIAAETKGDRIAPATQARLDALLRGSVHAPKTPA